MIDSTVANCGLADLRMPVAERGSGRDKHPILAAFVDSGWNRSNSDLRVLPGAAFLGTPGASRCSADDHDRIGHGTTCIRIFLQHAPLATVVPLRVFGRTAIASASSVVRALRWCVENRIKLVNMSLGTAEDCARNQLYRACRDAYEIGTILVAAAHNNSYPSCFDVVLSAGMSDMERTCRYPFHRACATEVLVSRHMLRRFIQRESGHSYAAALVSGMIATMLHARPNLTLDEARDCLEAEVDAR